MARRKRNLSFDDLCNLIALEVGGHASPHSVRKYLTATYTVIIRQLKMNGRINFYKFGTFEIYDRPSGDRLIGDPKNGGTQLVYVKPKVNINFYPSDIFDRYVNTDDEIVAKEKRRLKRNRFHKNGYDALQIEKAVNKAINLADKRRKGKNNG